MSSKVKNNLKLTNIEMIFVIVMLLVSILGGIIIFSLSTKNQNLENFKSDVDNLVKAAKNSYIAIEKQNTDTYIITSSDGTTKGMCITLQGLKSNDFLTEDYPNWDGYIVIEETNEDKINYGIWMTNQKYVINGYDSAHLSDLKLDEGITKYENETFQTKVRQSFTGISGKNGGTGSLDGKVLKTYEIPCINEKIE